MFDWEKHYRGNLAWLPFRTIFLTRTGSRAHGTALASSDEDYRGVAIPPREYYLGNAHQFAQEVTTVPDLVVYEMKKFCRLATQANPNIIEILFTDPGDHLRVTQLGERLLAGRQLFLSRAAGNSFRGCAREDLRRVKAWATVVGGYAPSNKTGMRIVRLLRVCREILETGQVVVKRPDAEELLAIRGGAWTNERLIQWAEAEDAALAALTPMSPLPPSPALDAIDLMCVELIRETMQ